MAIGEKEISALVSSAEEGSIRSNLANAKDSEGLTPLHYAAAKGSIKAIVSLIKVGAKLEARDNEKRTPLHHAAMNGQIEAIKALLAEGAILTARDENGQTALHHAAMNGQIEVINVLLAEGMKLEDTDKQGNTALDYYAIKHSSGHKILAEIEIEIETECKTIFDQNEQHMQLTNLKKAMMALQSLLWESDLLREEQGKVYAFVNAGLEHALGFDRAKIEPPEAIVMFPELTTAFLVVAEAATALRNVVSMPSNYTSFLEGKSITAKLRYASILDEVEAQLRVNEGLADVNVSPVSAYNPNYVHLSTKPNHDDGIFELEEDNPNEKEQQKPYEDSLRQKAQSVFYTVPKHGLSEEEELELETTCVTVYTQYSELLKNLQTAMYKLRSLLWLSYLPEEKEAAIIAIANKELAKALGFYCYDKINQPKDVSLPKELFTALQEVVAAAKPLHNLVSMPYRYDRSFADTNNSAVQWRYDIVLQQIEVQLERNIPKKPNFFDEGLDELEDNSFENEARDRKQEAEIAAAIDEIARLWDKSKKHQSALDAITPPHSRHSGTGTPTFFSLKNRHRDRTDSAPELNKLSSVPNIG